MYNTAVVLCIGIIATAASLLGGCTLASTGLSQISTEPAEPLIELPGSLLFVSDRDGEAALYNIASLVNEDAPLLLLGGEYDISDPAVTYKADKIAYASNEGGARDIYVASFNPDIPEVSEIQQITHDDDSDGFPQWSRNGQMLVFDASEEGFGAAIFGADWRFCPPGAGPAIYDVRERLISSFPINFCAGNATWSPNGKKFALLGPPAQQPDSFFDLGLPQLLTVPTDIQNGEWYDTDLQHIANPGIASAPEWSPDGEWIVYTLSIPKGTFPVESYDHRINIAKSDGSGERTLALDVGLGGQASWSPDSKYVAYSSNHNGNFDIYVQALAGGEPIQITDNPANDWSPEWYGAPVAGTIWTLLPDIPSLNEPVLWGIAIVLVLLVLLAIKLAWGAIRREVKEFNEENRK